MNPKINPCIFAKVVHSCCQFWCTPNFQFWCIVSYRLQLNTANKLELKTDKEKFKESFGKRVFAVPTNEHSLNLSYEFLNPLRYEITYSDSLLPDANFESVNEFLDAVSQATILFDTDKQMEAYSQITAGGGRVGKDKNSHQEPAILCGCDYSDLKTQIPLRWYLINCSKFQKIDDLEVLKNIIVGIDVAFFDLTKHSNNIDDDLINLSKQKSLFEFERQFKSLGTSIKFVQTDASQIKLIIENPKTQYLIGKYSDKDGELQSALDEYKNGLVKIDSLLLSTKMIIKTLLPVYNQYDESIPNHNQLKLKNVAIKEDKMRDIKVTIRERNLNVSDDKVDLSSNGKVLASTEFRIRAYQKWITEFSMGVFSSYFISKNYEILTEKDEMYIKEGKTSKYFGGPAAFLNLIKPSNGSLVNFMFQLGVGTKDFPRPVILAGPGIRFKTKVPWSLSAGALNYYEKSLNSLEVGQAVENQTLLESDLKYKPKLSWYVCLQLKL